MTTQLRYQAAQQRYKCSLCLGPIYPGEKYWFGVTDDQQHVHQHGYCRDAHRRYLYEQGLASVQSGRA